MPPTQSESPKNNFFASLPTVPSSGFERLQLDIPEGKVKHDKETVIILDWDDTLLASSYLSGKGYRLDTEKITDHETIVGLKELETSVLQLVNLALSFGTVNIVTNAETGWVQLSAAKFLPGVVPMLSRVNVLSARSTYEHLFPEAPLKWKFYAFQERLSRVFAESKKEKNILSFGDSHVEREAVRAVTRGFPNTKTKSVKFAERPSLEQLRRQIDLVTNCFSYIHNHEGDLDLQLTVTVNTNANPSAVPPANTQTQNNSAENKYVQQFPTAPIPAVV